MSEVRPGPLARAVFVALALATVLGLLYAQEVKRRDPLLKRAWPSRPVRFQPGGSGIREAHFHLKTSVTDRLEVSIIAQQTGSVVAVLGPLVIHKYRHISPTWSGRAAGGGPAPPGTYLVRVRFLVAGRTVPTALRLVLEGPSR